jgi:two-component system, OmpR family, alkaline phosphatase synthesis response regulator PhoP
MPYSFFKNISNELEPGFKRDETMMKATKIVVIEDEKDIRDVIVYNLQREGYTVFAAETGEDGLQLINDRGPDLIILDIMLPGIDGLSVCQQVRTDSLTKAIPIIVVSAKEEESDVIIGLGLGADDYVTKPFSPRELLARVRTVLRRTGYRERPEENRVKIKDLLIDVVKHEVRLSGKIVPLTATEFKILYQLASQPGRAFSREQLLHRALGEGVVRVTRNIDVHIRALRKKLAPADDMIDTIRGIGYRFVSE